jgi:hypothetical protein
MPHRHQGIRGYVWEYPRRLLEVTALDKVGLASHRCHGNFDSVG